MPLTLQADPIPLRADEQGAIRVGASQVLLDVVIREFENGAGPEEIAHGYSTLQLADVYAVIAYYLRHQEEVDNYLRARRVETDRLRQEIEAKQPGRSGLRSQEVTEASPSRNIAVAYDEVVLTEEDAEILRQMRETPASPVGRPTRPPRRMQDG